MTYLQLCRDQKNYINKLQKHLNLQENVVNKEDVVIEIATDINNIINIKANEIFKNECEIESNKIIEKNIIVEEEQKTHLIDLIESNIEFKPLTPIKRLNNHPQKSNINNFINETNAIYSNNNNIKHNNPEALDNYICSSEG